MHFRAGVGWCYFWVCIPTQEHGNEWESELMLFWDRHSHAERGNEWVSGAWGRGERIHGAGVGGHISLPRGSEGVSGLSWALFNQRKHAAGVEHILAFNRECTAGKNHPFAGTMNLDPCLHPIAGFGR